MDSFTPPVRAFEPVPLDMRPEDLRLVVYGDFGVGKTTIAGTFPRPCIVDTDAGLVSVAVMGYRPMTFEPTGAKDLEALYRYIVANSEHFDSIVIDSFTELQRLLLDEIVDEGAQKAEQSDKAHRSILRYVPEQAEYLANQRQLHRILHGFRRLGKHIVLTCGVRDRFGQTVPDMAPGLLSIVGHWSSIIGYLQTWQESAQAPARRFLMFDPNSSYMAKSRFFALGQGIEIPAPQAWLTGQSLSPFQMLEHGMHETFRQMQALAGQGVVLNQEVTQ